MIYNVRCPVNAIIIVLLLWKRITFRPNYIPIRLTFDILEFKQLNFSFGRLNIFVINLPT